MSENMKNVQCVTSLAVFRELYNRQRNVYDVIAEFAKTIIVSKALKSFELQQMCGYLNCEYSLVLTSAVVKTALKKVSYLTRTGQNYVVNETFRIEEAMEFQLLYVCIAVVSIVLGYKCTTDVNIFRGVVFISIAIPVIMQVLQGWFNPIVYKNMFFLLNRKIRIQYIRKIVGEYAKNHPKPHIKIYTVEDYV